VRVISLIHQYANGRKEYVRAKKQTVAKNAVPAAVVPRRDRAKGNREERGGQPSVKHTEELK
jgi:hypothetical protein